MTLHSRAISQSPPIFHQWDKRNAKKFCWASCDWFIWAFCWWVIHIFLACFAQRHRKRRERQLWISSVKGRVCWKSHTSGLKFLSVTHALRLCDLRLKQPVDSSQQNTYHCLIEINRQVGFPGNTCRYRPF